ncbi:MAG: diguanylate cyclase [Pseudomonadota bacterium]
MPCKNNEAENCELLKEMRDKLDSYQLCVEKNLQEVNSLNVKHEQRVNELSTIINIFEYINMVTDYKNLFAIINDMLIGVLGASSSTMYKYEAGCYRVESSSLSRKESLQMDSVGAKLCELYGDRKEAFILTEAELKANFSERKETKSAVVVPLAGKKELLGIIFLEHTRENYFQPDNCKYLNTLGITIRLSLENARLYSRLEEMALVDGLTGLYNRMFFNSQIQNCMEDYKKYGMPFILAILDLDHFKSVNDTYGHVCGDMVLQQISGIIKSEIRSDDFVCRYGGEEFAIIFRNSGDIEGVRARLETIRQKIEKNIMQYQDSTVKSTCSFGAVCCTASEKLKLSDEVVRKADEALYSAKKAGRNRICIAM